MASSSHGVDAKSLDLPISMIDTATPVSAWIVILPVLLCLFGGALLVFLRSSARMQAWFAMLVVLGVIWANIQLVLITLSHGPISMTMGKWLPPFGISFTADVLSASFALAASIATLVVLFYVQVELQTREVKYGFYPLVLMLLCGVSGAFLTSDLFNLYVWFEVLLIASFGLMIMGGRKVQLDAAVKYGFLNFLATTFFLISLGFLYGQLGTLNMADIARLSGAAPAVPMTAIAALMLLAFGMKAAAFPVNAWLPASYHAPDAGISALFAGLLTKVGVYALLRSLIVLIPDGRDFLEPVIAVIAIGTLIVGPLGAMSQTNLRRALGFLVIGGIGSILAGLVFVSPRGLAGASIYAFNAMLTMTAFYLVAGLVERMCGTDDTRHMGGIYAVNSPLSIGFLFLVFAAAGLPPTLGFWPKLLLVEASVEVGSIWDFALLAAILLNSILTTIAGTRLWAHIFWRTGPEGAKSEQPNKKLRALTNDEENWALVPTCLLILAIAIMGLFPNFIIEAGGNAAMGLLDPSQYSRSIGLEVTP